MAPCRSAIRDFEGGALSADALEHAVLKRKRIGEITCLALMTLMTLMKLMQLMKP